MDLCTIRADVSMHLRIRFSLTHPRVIACFGKQLRAKFFAQVCRIVWPQVMAYIGAPTPKLLIVPRSTMCVGGWLFLSFYGSNSMTSVVESFTIVLYRKFVTQTQPIGTSDNAAEWSIMICIVAVSNVRPPKRGFGKKQSWSRRPLLFSFAAVRARQQPVCPLILLRSFL